MIITGDNYNNSSDGRAGNWMQTFGGRQFWPLDPRPEEIFIEDIAHALSNACRYAGHCDRFYSVAEHSVLVSRIVPPENALVGLLHDASETYVVDIPRPLKPALSGYKEIEHRVWVTLATRFGLPIELPDSVKHADNAMLLAERAQILKAPPADWKIPGEPACISVECLPPAAAEQAFLVRFAELMLQRSAA